MAETGAGSGRIVLVKEPRERLARREPPLARRAERAVTAAPESREDAGASGWTVRQLVNGASLGGIATVVGGLLFQRNFEFLGNSNAPVLAIGFGLFVVGMIVFTLCLIGLASAAIGALLDRAGRAAAAGATLAPIAVLALLFAAGLLPPAFLALFAIVAIGGLTLALRR